MNSLVFNKTADELRTSVYGYNQDTAALQLLQLNSEGELRVASNLNITNTLLTVEGDITIANTLLTVNGDVTVTNTLLTVSGDITVTNTLLTVTGDITVFVEGNQFTLNSDTIASGAATGIMLPNTNISQLRTATMFIENIDTNPITVTLQLSPNGTTYFADPNYTDIVVDGSSSTIVVLGIFAQFAQFEYEAETSATINAYFNGQA